MSTDTEFRCGYVAIVGRPNVGKSTLLNHILGQKLSITSRKPQTTRHNIVGVKTSANAQVLYIDTPGLHNNNSKALNRSMNRSARAALKDVDVAVFMVDRLRWTEEDERVAERLEHFEGPLIIAVNKVDMLERKEDLLPQLQSLSERFPNAEIVPLSALQSKNLDRFESLVESFLPISPPFYPEDQLTDRSSKFLAAEIVREKITRQLGNELPYQMVVEIEEFSHENGVLHISALVLVERDGQKKILIGNKGDRLKKIGEQSRKDMEALFDSKVMLKTWVKVKAGWSDDERALKSLGFD